MKPLVFDLFAGLFGWGEAFAQHGWQVVGFDIEDQFKNFGKQMPENCELVLCDVRSLTGAGLVAKYGVPACIVGSPPCQRYSWMAMPWSKARAAAAKIRADQTGQLLAELNELFHTCFRLQKDISAAAGHYVPMVIENVRGAQPWVGRANWNFGSFYLFGDTPALMPIPGKIRKTPEGSWDLTRKNYNPDHLWKGEGNKTAGMNWSDRSKTGQDFARIAGRQAEGIKMRDEGYDYENRTFGWKAPATSSKSSKSSKRKQASAEIAKIPPALASWIAKTFLPKAAVNPPPPPHQVNNPLTTGQ